MTSFAKNFLCVILIGLGLLLASGGPAQAGGALTSGTSSSGVLNLGNGYTENYTFTANTGENVVMHAVATIGVTINVTGPGGYAVSGSANRFVSSNLAAGGTYNVTVTGPAGNFQLMYVNSGGAVANGNLTSGSVASGSIGLNGMLSYKISATAGQFLLLQTGLGTSIGIATRVYNPDGTSLSLSSSRVEQALATTGNYTVIIEPTSNLTTSTTQVYAVLGAGAVSSGSLTSSATANGTLPVNGLMSYQFTAAAGEYFRIQVDSVYSGNYIWVMKPDGTAYAKGTNRFADAATASGTYTVVVQASNITYTGAYKLYFAKGNDSNNKNVIVSGNNFSGDLVPNEIKTYVFDAVAGQGARIHINSTYGMFISIYAPDGTFFTVSAVAGRVDFPTPAATQSGRYTIVLYATYITDTGTFDFNFFRGASDVSEGELFNGVAQAGEFLARNAINSYKMNAQAGTATITTTSSLGRQIWLYKPDGSYQTSNASSLTGVTLATSGVYTLYVIATTVAQTGDYDITATFTPIADTATTPDQSTTPEGCQLPGGADAAAAQAIQAPADRGETAGGTNMSGEVARISGPSPSMGNPINFDVGYKQQTAVDYDAGALSFIRVYRSDSTWTNNTVGTYWRHNYARTLTVTGGTAASITDASGVVRAYTLTGGNWVPNDLSNRAVFKTITGGYSYTLPNNTVEKYNATFQLTRIEYMGGGAVNLAYNGSGQLTSVTNENGRAITLTYVSGKVNTVVTPDGTFTYGYTGTNLTTVTRPDTKTTTYHYENLTYTNALTGITDAKGVRYATFGYDASGKAISSQHAGGVDSYTFNYTTNTSTNPLGKDTKYYYRNIGGVRRVMLVSGIASANCVASYKKINYDALGRVISKTDWQNHTTRYQYDSRGNVVYMLEAAGRPTVQRATTISWITSFNLPDVVTEPGITTDYDYDTYGRLVTMTVTDTATAETRITTYAYYSNGTDGSGNVILGRLQQVNGPRTDVSDLTTYAYDGNYNLTTVTNSLSQVTTVSARDSAGRPTTIQDMNGINTVLTYDTNGWLQTATRASGTGLAALYDFDYDFNGNIVKVTLPNSVFVEYSYDNAQRLTGIKDSLNNTVTYTLNNAGDATKAEVKNVTPTTTYVHDQAFDELSRLIRSIGAATPAQTAVFAYDKNSNLTSYTDPKANPATTYTYDALQRLSTQTNALSGVTTLGYSGLDDLTSVKDQRNHTTSYTYNAFGDVRSEISPDRGTINYIVDKAGNVTKRTDARSVVTDYTYDALNRLLTVVYPAETALNATLSYDLSSGCGTPYKGHLCRVVDNTGTTNYQYDSLGRVTSVSETRGALTFTQSYTYDLAGNIATMTMPSGRVVTYTRNANGLVSNVAAPINGSATNLASSITYLPFGPQNAMTYGNAKTFSATYDTDYNPTNRTVSGGLYNWTYTTDKNSNITQAGTTTYGYDALDRVNAENPGAAASYTYDATSNRLTKVQGGTITTTVPAANNKISAVGGTAYTYDAAGNITAIGTNGYVWSNQGLMKEYKISGVSTATYTYNAYNQRTKKVTGGVTTHYVYGAGGLMLGEYTTAGAMVREYIYLNQVPLTQVNSGSPETVTYIHTDHLGTPRFGTNSAGTSVWSWANDAFGISAASGATTINLRLAGQYYDSESSLFYNWNRYYNPAIGRYISSDPIGLAGGLNTFGYVGQSPVMWIDPMGLAGMGHNKPPIITIQQLLSSTALASEFIGFGAAGLAVGMYAGYNLVGFVGSYFLPEDVDCPLGGGLPNANAAWGKNRLIKELHDRGFIYDKPTTGEGGFIYKNANTGEQIRILPRPNRVPYSNDPTAKFENDWYYRYRTRDQPWGPATTIPNK
ncbi:MAG: DUF6531 domain-containing protein [bacterium]|nr:DUF6531 domain-containing protein [bacterium]